jgi:hypothetical protein
VTQSTVLRLAPNLLLPLNAVTRKHAFLGTTGSGKTYAATKTAELMIAAGAQIVALDPVGVWWGLRLAADGEAEGIKIPVFGGLHGDLPLEPGAGAVIADVICDRAISAVIDLSQFEYDTDRTKFSKDFARRLFFRKKSAPSAIHVFYEEAQNFMPQNPQRGEEQMVHNFLKMDKEGRNFGIGRSIISQRPQEISKRALNLTELVLAFQTNGPHERKSIADWVKEQGEDVDVVALLPKLKTGHAHAWSPSWLEISETVHIEKKSTFNASATPEVGEVAVDTKELAPIDLEKIKADMAETIEKQKENDPDELKKRIKELERHVKKGAPAPEAVTRTVVDQDAIRRAIEGVVAEADRIQIQFASALTDELGELETISVKFGDSIGRVRKIAATMHEKHVSVRAIPTAPHMLTTPNEVAREFKPQLSETRSGTNGSQSAEQKILNALAALGQLGFRAAKKTNVAFFAGYTENWRFDGRIADLREKGLVEVVGPGELSLTAAGRQVADATQSIRSLDQLHSTWLSKLPAAESKALGILLENHPRAVDRATLATRLERTENWRFDALVNRLKGLGVADFPDKRHVVASEALFPAGLT